MNGSSVLGLDYLQAGSNVDFSRIYLRVSLAATAVLVTNTP